MLSVKLITPKRINGLYLKTAALSVILVAFLSLLPGAVIHAQDNSPYTRYGIGDLVPTTNAASRGMGGVSAGYTDFLTINFNNPATYASFQAFKEAKSKKLSSGRAVLDLGLNFESRTLREPNNPTKFVASNALFSHVQVGVPLRKNLGLSFGLRPISRISYRIGKSEILFDPNTGQRIDSAYTENFGDGGSYLASMGAGWKLHSKISGDREVESFAIGVNAGYFFGKKDYSTRRTLLNDTVEYYRGNFETRTTYGNIFFNAGVQYKVTLNNEKRQTLTIGAYGNWKQKLNGKQDIIRETYFVDLNTGNTSLDSVSIRNDIRGDVLYPSNFTVGFLYEKEPQIKEAGWMFGVDFQMQNWSEYRFYDQKDFVANKWELRVGSQLRPAPSRNYFSNVAYRAGFFIGPDYVKVQKKLPQFGASFGVGLPIANYRSSFASLNQATIINLAFEYIKRGNNDNLLKENMFRFTLGFSLSDLWFIKRKYD